MIVDVLYEGLPLARGANAREEGSGAFIELESPMPVGTRVTVRGPDGDRPARVDKVHEGIGPGVVVSFVDGRSLGDPGSQRKASQLPQAEVNAPTETMGGDTVPDEPDGGGAEGEPEPGGDDQPGQQSKKSRKDRRGKNRKSAAGH
jgi:hypothetical protein